MRDPETGGYAVKRIVATPGDRVYVQGGQFFVNSEILLEPYLERVTETCAGPQYRAEMWVCGSNQFFELSDTREMSKNSRMYGAVSGWNIMGLVTL